MQSRERRRNGIWKQAAGSPLLLFVYSHSTLTDREHFKKKKAKKSSLKSGQASKKITDFLKTKCLRNSDNIF